VRLRYWLGRLALALLLLLLLLTAYGYYATREKPIATRSVLLKGQLTAAPGLSGEVQVRVFQAWAGEGALRHPLESIASFKTALGDFEKTIDYPLDNGEGLIVYAWLDADGDGIHCTPTRRGDPAGLTEVTPFPAATVTVSIDMNRDCAGPEAFFPH
jgi:hypothetical protein